MTQPSLRDQLLLAQQPFKLPNHKGFWGIEIEAETDSEKDYPKDFFVHGPSHNSFHWGYSKLNGWKHWSLHKDDSLRGFGLEYVTTGPKTEEELWEALEEFQTKTKGVKFHKDSPMTSVHVHMNAGSRSIQFLGTFLTLWVMFENVLISFCSPSRTSNLFALPFRTADAMIPKIVKMFEGFDNATTGHFKFQKEQVKYGALNLCRLWDFGSIEARSLHGTTDTEVITKWILLLRRLVRWAEDETVKPPELLEYWHDDKIGFFGEVFGDHADTFKLSTSQIKEFVSRNLFYAKLIADSVKDWEAVNTSFSRWREAAEKEGRIGKFGGEKSVQAYDENGDIIQEDQPQGQDPLVFHSVGPNGVHTPDGDIYVFTMSEFFDMSIEARKSFFVEIVEDGVGRSFVTGGPNKKAFLLNGLLKKMMSVYDVSGHPYINKVYIEDGGNYIDLKPSKKTKIKHVDFENPFVLLKINETLFDGMMKPEPGEGNQT